MTRAEATCRRILAGGHPPHRVIAQEQAWAVSRGPTDTLHQRGDAVAAQLSRRGIDTALFWAALSLLTTPTP